MFAEDIGRKLRIESRKNRNEKWRKRASRMLNTFVCACGGEVATGVVALAGKPVRIDYLKKSMRQLANDKPVGTSIFYKSLPVDVEAWIRAMCHYNIATSVPAWWSVKRARVRSVVQQGLVTRMGVRNEVAEAEPVLLDLAINAKRRGLRVQRVHEDTADRLLNRDGSATGVFRLASPRDVISVSETSAETSEVMVRIRPTQTLEFEEVIGLLERGGRVVCIGNQRRVVLTFFIEPGGTLFKTCRKDQAPHYLRECAETCVSWPSWTMEVNTPTFLFGDPLHGADTRVTMLRGVRLEVLMFIHATCEPGEKHCRLDDMVKAFLQEMRMDERAVRVRPTSPHLSHTNCNLVETLCELVTRASQNRNSQQSKATTPPQTWEGAPFAHEEEEPPLVCRNGWVMPSGTVVEKTDPITHHVRSRARWPTNFTKCLTCPTLHPDSKKRGMQRCNSIACKSRFWVSDTLTHYRFKAHKFKRVEVDKNEPLFTDAALRELESKSNFVFHRDTRAKSTAVT